MCVCSNLILCTYVHVQVDSVCESEGGRGKGGKRKGACVRDRAVIPVNDTLQVLLNHYVKVQGQVISQVQYV